MGITRRVKNLYQLVCHRRLHASHETHCGDAGKSTNAEFWQIMSTLRIATSSCLLMFMDFVDRRNFNGSDIADEKCCRCRNWSRFPNTCWHDHLLWNHSEISWAYVHRYFVKFWKTLFHNAWYRCRSKTDGIVVWRSLRNFYFFLQWLYSNFNQKYQFH